MSSAGFKPTVPTNELQQTYALDRRATGTGQINYNVSLIINSVTHVISCIVLSITYDLNYTLFCQY